MKYKFLKHTADMKFQAYGKNISECFKNASYALREIISEDKIKPVFKKNIKIIAKSKEELLYNFLEEFLIILDSKGLIMSEVESIEIIKENNKFRLSAEIYLDKIKKYKAITDVKAITYNEMFVNWEKPYKKCKLQVVCDV